MMQLVAFQVVCFCLVDVTYFVFCCAVVHTCNTPESFVSDCQVSCAHSVSYRDDIQIIHALLDIQRIDMQIKMHC